MWPKSSSKKEWATVDADLIKILDGVKGTVEKKLEKIGDLIYIYGAERFGTKQTGKKDMTPTIPPKSRRQQEIQRLVKQRRDLRKQWKRASVEERAGIDLLQTDLKGRLGRLRRAENLRTRRKRKERARTTFYKDPFRFVKGLFTKEKSGSLKVPKRELEDHLKTTHTDSQRFERREIPSDMPPIPQPEHQLDDSPPRWTFNFFHIPSTITNLVRNYFQDLQFCIQTTEYTTSWQSVEVGIMAGCTISPLAFTMAMEVIIRASKWVVGGERLQSGQRLPPIRAYMDDMTTLTSTIACTKHLLGKLQANITWARMKFKPSKSRSISIVKGKLVDQRFYIKDTPIPLVSELPVKSLGRWYNASLKDSDQCDQLREETIKGLVSIDKTLLPGKLKLWCLQFGLLPRLMWPLTVYEIPMTKVEKLERTVSSYIKKWLGLPRCLSNIGLYGHGALELPVSSLTEEYKCTKVRLNMTLTESQDGMIQRLPQTGNWEEVDAI
ncbi:hypothetical protein AAFF_G00110750 [Aldrovandia affinis]|uniref:Reverse transcriptase domain-containing protein n=2 Tax=Aldrovandia affinis TaxID=143900 RepID=A0AAD7RTF8_9TELE|nr:hypothetical protein AAFF_G00110750 [Aldrovandia affinis]